MALFCRIIKLGLPASRQCSKSVFQRSRRPILVQTECQNQTLRPFCNNDSHIKVKHRHLLVGNKPFQWCKTFHLARNWSRSYHFTCLHVGNYGNHRQININLFSKRFISEVPKSENKQGQKQPTVFQRFKAAYKEHGKILIGVHIVTSIVWFGLFYVAASEGIDVIPLMERLGFSETIIKPFRNPSIGNLALAYLLYELAKPVRYAATLAGTNIVIRYLRKRGKMAPPKESLKNLATDSRKKMEQKISKNRQRLKKGGVTLRQRIKKGGVTLRQRIRTRSVKLGQKIKRGVALSQKFKKRRLSLRERKIKKP